MRAVRAIPAVLVALLFMAVAGSGALLSGCDPVVVPASAGAAASANPGAGIGASARPTVIDIGATQGSTGTDDAARRVEALDRALRARDLRLRELQDALIATSERAEQDLTRARDERLELEKRLSAKIAALEGRLQEISTTVEQLAFEVKTLDAEGREVKRVLQSTAKLAEALRAASPLPNLAADIPRVEGRILSLERAQDGLIVLLDVGQKAGLKAQVELVAVRAGKPLAKLVLDRVEPDISSGRVLWAKEGEAIREGDLVTTRP